MARLGYIGLGTMGGRMANRLLTRGHTVTGYNQTRSKPQWLIENPMTWADSPRATAAASDVVFVMVTDSGALDAVARGADGFLSGLTAGKTVIDMSTVSPAASR